MRYFKRNTTIMDCWDLIMKNRWTFAVGVFQRVGLLAGFVWMEVMTPFNRVIHKEEAWLYANPQTESYLPTRLLWPMVLFLPPLAVAMIYFGGVLKSSQTGRLMDAFIALWVVSLLMPLNGFVTNTIKV